MYVFLKVTYYTITQRWLASNFCFELETSTCHLRNDIPFYHILSGHHSSPEVGSLCSQWKQPLKAWHFVKFTELVSERTRICTGVFNFKVSILIKHRKVDIVCFFYLKF